MSETLRKGEWTSDILADIQRQLERLKGVTAEFKEYHLAIVDLVEEEQLGAEQAALDELDDRVMRLTSRLQTLTKECDPTRSSSGTGATGTVITPNQRLSKRLKHAQSGLQSTGSAVDTALASSDVDTCLLSQYECQLNDIKSELTCISRDILSLDADDPDLSGLESELGKLHFDTSLKIRRALQIKDTTGATPEREGAKLPRLDIPIFDGSFVNWTYFWEQYNISVHSKKQLTNTEKLAYLKNALKGGAAKHVIEGLTGSGDHYEEAIECLQKRYNRPRLIHQAHVRAILDAPPLKDGTGRELRRLHDTVTQHLRALRGMDCEPLGPFVTSALELKLDSSTVFEWQKASQDSSTVPHYSVFLEFINLRAQASETISKSRLNPHKVTSFVTTAAENACSVCKSFSHPLYSCAKFKLLPHEQMMMVVKNQGLCMNCLKPGHYSRHCTSVQKCRRCQKPHHTLLHVEVKSTRSASSPSNSLSDTSTFTRHDEYVNSVHSHAVQSQSKMSQTLLTTCRVLVTTTHGVTTQARALLDSASSTSFISEHLAQSLNLPRSRCAVQVTGIGGMSDQSRTQSYTCFQVSSTWSSDPPMEVEAIILPKVTCQLPVHSVKVGRMWTHLSGLKLADPDFASPGRIELLLGADIFSSALRNGRRTGPPGSPVAIETSFGWVLSGAVSGGCQIPVQHVLMCHPLIPSTDELLRRFWEMEEVGTAESHMSPEERTALKHFRDQHQRDPTGRFLVPLPKKHDAAPLGESRTRAVRRFLSLQRSLQAKGQLAEFNSVMEEYLDLNHAERVPSADLDKPREEVFYFPVHVVTKDSSTTTKIRVVFDASAQSTSGVSLNDKLLIGPTVHSSFVDVLLRFRLHRVALTTDVSKMYRAILLHPMDRNLHRFVWRRHHNDTLVDYRTTRLTFGVASTSFIASMSLKQNALDFTQEYPLAAQAVHQCFYVDDGLVGADSIADAIVLQRQLHELFLRGGFALRKWKSSDARAIEHVPIQLLDAQHSQAIPDPNGFSKTLGLEWSAKLDCFRLSVTDTPQLTVLTKRALVSNVAKLYDVLGWFAPSIILAKVLLQRLWEAGIGWMMKFLLESEKFGRDGGESFPC